MNQARKLFLLCKEIGVPRLAEYANYQVEKRTGLLKKRTPFAGIRPDFDLAAFEPKEPPPLTPRSQSFTGFEHQELIQEAGHVLKGFYRPFGGNLLPLSFESDWSKTKHWTKYGDTVDGVDIKWIWEPARFSWAFTLARAYLAKQDERYVSTFWEQFKRFNLTNPVNRGPNWVSAQESALRIMTWSMVFVLFKDSPTTTLENKKTFYKALWQHTARIPASLAYARSQNNNHHLSEALGLIVGGAFFSETSNLAKKWLEQGFKEFNKGLLRQIEPDGTYGQHSANYHRLMLQLALIYYGYAKLFGVGISQTVQTRLAAATRWMTAQLDPQSGRLPNLGHNDGSLLLPIGAEEFRDYRPTAQAASLAFLGKPCLPPGAWNELVVWLNLPVNQTEPEPTPPDSPASHKITAGKGWATLRGVHFHGRPAHADQLHVDVWWDGINIAQDAGTFSYNDPMPWQNPFSTTLTHNTISIDDRDQMHPAGKFLWLDQAQAEWLIPRAQGSLQASHNGYRRLGIVHEREFEWLGPEKLVVTDLVRFSKQEKSHKVTLHWLLQDWAWKLEEETLILSQGMKQVRLSIRATRLDSAEEIKMDDLAILRGGETLHGKRQNPILGWVSDTYGEKVPALSLSIVYQSKTSLQIITNWEFSDKLSG